MDVARDEQVDVAVAIVIGPGRAGAEAAAAHSGFFGYVLELAVAQVVIEHVAAKAGDVNIVEAVVVVIGHGDAHAPTFSREARGFGDVGELGTVAAS